MQINVVLQFHQVQRGICKQKTKLLKKSLRKCMSHAPTSYSQDGRIGNDFKETK